MKKKQVLTSLKFVIAFVLIIISGLIIYSQRSGVRLTSSTRAAETCSICEDAKSAKANCDAYIQQNGTATCGWENDIKAAEAQCDACRKAADENKDCPSKVDGKCLCRTRTKEGATYCKDGRSRIDTLCGGCNPERECTEKETCYGGPLPTPVPGGSGGGGPVQPPTPTLPVTTGWPAGKDCRYVGSGCVTASFNKGAPPLGKMWCCTANLVTGPDGARYGNAEPCDPGKCGGDCSRHPEGGVHTDTTCKNPYSCPVLITPTVCPTIKQSYCETRDKANNNCFEVDVYKNQCTGEVVRTAFPPTIQPRPCSCGSTPTPPPPTKPPTTTKPSPTPTRKPSPTPALPGTCTSLQVTLEKGGSVNVTSATANNVLPRVPEPGEKITVNSASSGPASQFVNYWIRPIDSPNVYDPVKKDYTPASVCSFYVLNPDGQPSNPSGTFTMPNWKDGKLRRNDNFGKQAICNNQFINFDKGVIFGVVYLQPNIGWSGNTWCRNAGPATNAGILHLGSASQTKTCQNWCVAQATAKAVVPTPTRTPTPGPNTPTPSRTPTPAPNACGYSPCDNDTAPCQAGLTCIQADDGNNYCSRPNLTQQCSENPSTTSCCTVATPTPTRTPTPQPAQCGDTCSDDQPCGNGMVCVDTPNGSRCSMNEYQNACREEGNYTACCTAPTPTPAPTFTPQPTFTPFPTPTPYPTFTPLPPPPTQVVIAQVQQVQPTYTPVPPPPTYTIIPTYTPFPTQQPQLTYTPVPPPPAAGNPIPFIIAGIPIVLLLLGLLL